MNRNEFKQWCGRRNGEFKDHGNVDKCEFGNGGDSVQFLEGNKYSSSPRIEVNVSDMVIEAPPQQVAKNSKGELVLVDGTGFDESQESEFNDPTRLLEQDYNISVGKRGIEIKERN